MFGKFGKWLSWQVGSDDERFREGLNAENALSRLKAYNDAPERIARAKRARDADLEWFLNSFQYASYHVRGDDVVRMAEYMNQSQIFALAAPKFYAGTTWNHVVSNMFENCPFQTRLSLLATLERRGHMQGIVRANGGLYSLFYEMLPQGYSAAHLKAALRQSASFAAAKESPGFLALTIDHFPQFRDLIE